MSTVIDVSVKHLAGGNEILSGAAAGRRLFAKLVTRVTPSEEPCLVLLDFSGVKVATASFLREGVVGFRDHARVSFNSYVVVSNASSPVIEELELLIRQTGDAILRCAGGPGKARATGLLGRLDPVQQATFDLVTRHGPASAAELAAQDPSTTVGTTAWNNRLSWLTAKALIVERKAGKTKRFSAVLESK